MFKDYSKILSKAKYKKIYGEGLKILSPKQMLQRLPIALPQVNAGNTSGNFTKLNEENYIFFVSSKRNY